MKNKYILSGIVGGVFFAVPYLALSIGIVPSLITSGLAFTATSLITKENKIDNLGSKNLDVYKNLLENSKKYIVEIQNIIPSLEDQTIKQNVEEISNTSSKIISRLQKNPEKISQSTNFLNYYLPITLKILNKYNEIEDGNLTSKESKMMMKRVLSLIEKIKNAFNTQLNNLYSTDVMDINAEMKVFESILASDGLLDDNLSINKEGEKNEEN